MKTKYLAASIIALLLVGCEPSAKDNTANYVLPEGLKDCKVYYLSDTGGNHITVVRCPATPTSEASTATRYPSGKTTKTVTVVETTTLDASPTVAPSPAAPEAPEAPK